MVGATASQAGTDLCRAVASLSSRQRRCLEVVCQFASVAHAARRLHWSQAVLDAELRDLANRLGRDAIHLQERRVIIAEALKRSLSG